MLDRRIRFRYSKTGRIRYTSQRDVARCFERALRRANAPVAYSQGFSPRPLLAFGLALPTGAESLAEYVDIRFDEAEARGDGASLELGELVGLLDAYLPDGIDMGAAGVLEGSKESLQEQVALCTWIVEVTGMGAAQIEERVGTLLSAASVPLERERKGRTVSDDLRPYVLDLCAEGPGSRPGSVRLSAALATKPRGVRPGELLRAIDPSLRLAYVNRTAQFMEFDGTRVEPLTRDGQSAAEQLTAMVG